MILHCHGKEKQKTKQFVLIEIFKIGINLFHFGKQVPAHRQRSTQSNPTCMHTHAAMAKESDLKKGQGIKIENNAFPAKKDLD